MTELGAELLEHAGRVKERVVLIAPFIKRDVLARLLDRVPVGLKPSVFTRWRLEEIAAGVSDLAVWELLRDSWGSSLFLCHHLHAKCYIFDDIAIVGSANLTAAALGWRSDSNLEIQVEVSAESSRISVLVRELQDSSVAVTDELYRRFQARLPTMDLGVERVSEPEIDYGGPFDYGHWLPQSRQPSQLYLVYEGRRHLVSSSGWRSGLTDLAYLELPTGLTEEQFLVMVQMRLEQLPLISRVSQLAAETRPFGFYRQIMREYLRRREIARDPTDAWQVLLRWILFFFPGRFYIESRNYSECLIKAS